MKMRLEKFLAIAIISAGCQQTDTRKFNADHLYFDYRVTADEGDHVACVFQYKWGGPEGEAIAVRAPGKVELDGLPLEADSAGFSGIYYEKYLPVEEFSGKHAVVFTSPDQKTFREEFLFEPFGVEELPEQIARRPFSIRLTNFSPAKTKVRLMLIDTAFSNNDVISLVFVENGELRITDEMLRQLKSGPVSMEIYREEERNLKNRTRAGGKFFISYGLQRDFELADP
jgi:hypothetical protein